MKGSPGWCDSVGGVLPRKPKGSQFNSRSGHMPGLRVWSPVRVCARDNPQMFLSHMDVSLPLFLPPFSSL